MSQLKNIVSQVKNFYKYPSLESAKILKRGENFEIVSEWTQNDVVSSKTKMFSINYLINQTGNILSESRSNCIDNSIFVDLQAKDGSKRVIIYKIEEKDKTEFHLNFFIENLLERSINLTKSDVHGKLIKPNFNFGKYQFDERENKLYYLAYKKPVDKVNYFIKNKTEDGRGEKYRIQHDYGEQLEEVSKEDGIEFCCVDLNSEKVEVLVTGLKNEEFIVGKFHVHNSEKIVLMAYKHMPYDLGLIYCLQRPSILFLYSSVTGESQQLTNEDRACLCGVWSSDGQTLFWLDNKVEGAHMQCQRLMQYNLSSATTSVVQDVVRSAAIGQFLGIYSMGILDAAVNNNDEFLVVTSLDRYRDGLILVDRSNGQLERIDETNYSTSCSVLDVCQDLMLVKASSPNILPFLGFASISNCWKKKQLIIEPISKLHSLSQIDWSIHLHEPSSQPGQQPSHSFYSIFVTDHKDSKPRPIILCLHGGPHSAFRSEFSIFSAVAVACGYCCLLINYRGSLGNGQDNIVALPGHIGSMDVGDCIKACEDLISQQPTRIASNKIHLYGGSHGGFLTNHLAGQYQARRPIASAACRNAVINLVAMATSTDIPDWVYYESSGLPWQHKCLVVNNDRLLTQIAEKSPIKFIDQIKCPMLIMIGDKDKRVPPSQGVELYRQLKSRNIPTELYRYPDDSHPLATLETNCDCLVHVFDWFANHNLSEL